MLESCGFIGRCNLGVLLRNLGLMNIAVELGSHRGVFASEFYSKWGGRILYCVDPWESGYDQTDPTSEGNRNEDYEEFLKHTSEFPENIFPLKMTGDVAAARFRPNSVDFVYVDANHQYESVLNDLRVWWTRIRPGGILAGHDFVCCNEFKGGWGQFIQPAVELFVSELNLPVSVYIVPETAGDPYSFYIRKPL